MNAESDSIITSRRTLGSFIRLLRRRNEWTLRQMGQKVGIPTSTLSKIEQNKLTLTYDKLLKLSSSLGMTLTEFFAQIETPAPKSAAAIVRARRSLPADANSVHISTPNYDYQYLCADLRDKRMVPIIARIKARDIAEFGEPLRHAGEEFIYVLEGTIEVHTEFYTPVIMTTGNWIYLDSAMGHAYVAKGCESALVLAVCSGEDPNLMSELMSMARSRHFSSARQSLQTPNQHLRRA
jgi:transcriptional regulator with XRE-family HTH domain